MSRVLVTGANRGIGLALCRGFLKRGYDVIGTSRQPSSELEAIGVQGESLDVSDPLSIHALSNRLKDTPIDILVNNAGVLSRDDLGSLNFDDIEQQFRVNAMGPLRVSQALRTNLGEGSKIVIITSRMGSMDDNTSGRMYGYRMSKAAVNMVGKGLSRDLAPDGIAVLLLHPGYVITDMTNQRGNWTAEAAAESMLARIEELQLGQSGAFWHADGTELPW